MIAYWLKRLMWILGYRRVLWLPYEKGLSLADFWTWEYMPWADKRDYTEHDYRRTDKLRAEIEALKAENEMLREALKDADNELDWLDEDMDTCDHSVGVCTCSYWNMRRKMKAALSKENSND